MIVYFLKDILVAIIQSVFKYVVNPTVWSRVAADINSSPSRATPEPIQRVQSISEPDVRDDNVSKALDLAKQHMQYLLEQKQQSQIQSSGVEMLAVRGISTEKSSSDITSSVPSNLTQQTTEGIPSSDGSGESYEEFAEDEIINVQNVSVITVGSATTQPSEISSEYSATMSTDDVNSTKSNDQSDSSGNTSMSLDTTKSAGDSVEILSISSDTPTS